MIIIILVAFGVVFAVPIVMLVGRSLYVVFGLALGVLPVLAGIWALSYIVPLVPLAAWHWFWGILAFLGLVIVMAKFCAHVRADWQEATRRRVEKRRHRYEAHGRRNS